MKTQDQENIPEFICVDPDVRTQYFDGYLDGTLSEADKQEFEDHLLFCFKCREDFEYWQWVIRKLQGISKFFFQNYVDRPLPVYSVYDRNQLDLTPYYDEKPLMNRLAASSGRSDRLAFPVTVEYAEGQVAGQFWKRTGQLFYRLHKSTIGQETVACTLIYTSSTDPSDVRTFEFREGQEKRLGAFREFVPSDTIQGMLEAMKRFQLVMNYKD